MGALTFHPWPVRRDDVDRPDELRIDLDPQPGTTFADAVRVAGVARELLEELGLRGCAKTSGNRGVHVFVRIEPRWEFVDVRHAAIGFGRELEKRDDGVTTAWWKEERGERIFVDFNQNCRDRTIASAYSLRPIAGRAGLDADDAGRSWPRSPTPRRTTSSPCPTASPTATPGPGIDDAHYSIEPLLRLFEEQGAVELNYPPDYPKMPGEPPRVQPSKKVAAHWDDEGNRIARLTAAIGGRRMAPTPRLTPCRRAVGSAPRGASRWRWPPTTASATCPRCSTAWPPRRGFPTSSSSATTARPTARSRSCDDFAARARLPGAGAAGR